VASEYVNILPLDLFLNIHSGGINSSNLTSRFLLRYFNPTWKDAFIQPKPSRIQRPVIPHHCRTLAVCAGIAFLCMNKVIKLFRVLNKEHRRVVSDEIPIPHFSVEFDREAAWIPLRIRASFLSSDSEESDQHAGLLSHLAEHFGFRVLGDVVRNRKRAVAPVPFAWTTRSGIRSRLKCAIFSCRM